MPKQNNVALTDRLMEYMFELKDGPKTTHDLVISMMVTGNSVAKAMKRLRAVGFVESHTIPNTTGGQYVHNLTADYTTLRNRVHIPILGRHTPIMPEHVYYAAILKNDKWTGRELVAQYQKVYPDKSKNAIKNIIMKAQNAKLCR